MTERMTDVMVLTLCAAVGLRAAAVLYEAWCAWRAQAGGEGERTP